MSQPDDEEPVHIPITDELDLHTFRPNEVGDLLVDYLGECQKLGILSVRVIHGKGTGALRLGVHAVLGRMEIVESWTWPAGERSGSWGATWVRLKPGNEEKPDALLIHELQHGAEADESEFKPLDAEKLIAQARERKEMKSS